MRQPMKVWSAEDDLDLVGHATAGDARALEALLHRHQAWVFNLALYMLQVRAEAEDATQEILLKVTTGLASFRGASSFRTWVRRVAVNHLLDRRRSLAEQAVHGFDCYADYLHRAAEVAPSPGSDPEGDLLVKEARWACSLGMLLCLDRQQRLSFVLGEVLELEDTIASEILGISRENCRQRLARARRDLSQFLAGRCGLVDVANPCRCARKTRAFVKDGIVDPAHLQFAPLHLEEKRQEAARNVRRLDVLRADTVDFGRLYPRFQPTDQVARIREILLCPRNAELFQ